MRPYEKETRQLVLDIAIRHFSQHGYAGANLELIGKEAGLTRGPLYYYFKNKKELYLAAVQEELERTVNSFHQIFEQEISIFDKIKQDLIFCSNNSGLIERVGKGGKDEPSIESLKEYSQEVYDLKYNSVIMGQNRGELRTDIDPKEITNMIYLCFHGLKQLSNIELIDVSDEEDFTNKYIDVIVEMVKSRYGKSS